MRHLPDPATLLPHQGDAVLLDEIASLAEDRLVARLTVRPGTAFSDGSGNLPGWVGPEIMAQAIAALAGERSLRAHGAPAEIGLLLGIRGFSCAAGQYKIGEHLQVEVVRSSEDVDGRAVFDATLARSGEVVAVATLTVFEPRDDSFLEEETARND